MSDDGKSQDRGLDPTLPAPATPVTPAAPPAGATRTGAPSQTVVPEREDADVDELPTVSPSTYAFGAEVARGGMGRISVARDRRLHRPVAIKEVLHTTPELKARFEREARITARLQHPAIVNVYEAGRWPTGEPFFAMKMVKGRSLKEVVAQTRSLAERLAILPKVIQISEALAYAHAERIVHRDLKPSNVLVGDYGETVVIDWGLAKDLRDEAPEPAAEAAPVGPELTVAGAVMGTPGYMAPEQVEGQATDERADVFALGAMLYFVLTGSAPFHGSSSTEILTATRAFGHTPIATQVPGVPRDLATIVEKAMARDPAARYPTARELAEELQAFQTGQLVKAHQYSRGELVRRWIRRHRGELLVAGLALVLGAGALGEAFRRIVNERDRAAEASRAATRRADELTLSQARQALDTNPHQVFELLSHLSLASPSWGAARLFADEARRRGIPQLLAGHQRPITRLAWDPRHRRMATGDLDGHVWLWELDGKGRELARVDGRVMALAFSPSGDRLAASWREAAGLRPWSAAWWSLGEAAPAPRPLARKRTWLSSLQFSGEDRLVAGTSEGLAEWTLPGGATHFVISGKPVLLVGASADGRWLGATTPEGEAMVHDRAAGTTQALAVVKADGLIWSPAAEWLAVTRGDGGIVLWSTSGKPTQELTGHELSPDACWLDDGRLASAAGDHEVRLWTLGGAKPKILRGHSGPILGIECSGDGHAMVTHSSDGTVRLWGDDGELLRVITGFVGTPGRPRFLLDERGGPHLAVPGSDELLRLYGLRDEARRQLDVPNLLGMAFSADGTTLATSHADGSLRLVDLAPGTSRIVAKPGRLASLAVLRDQRILTIGQWNDVNLWDPHTGGARKLEGISIGPLVASPDERRAAAPSSRTPDILVWDLESGHGEALVGHTSWVRDLVWLGPLRLASTGEDTSVRLWDLSAGRTWTLAGGGGPGNFVEASADGEWLAVAGDAWVRAYHLPSARMVSLEGLRGRVTALAFAPSGWGVAAGFETGGAVFWPEPDAVPRVYFARAIPTTALAFDPRGATLTIAAVDGWIAQWDLASGERRDLQQRSAPDMPREFREVLIGWAPGRSLLVTGGSYDRTLLWADELPTEPEPLLAWLRAR